jgi:hypothetical protein
VFTQGFNLTGQVGQSVYSFAEGINAAQEAQVAGDLVGFAEGVNVDGKVGRDLIAFAGDANLAGGGIVGRHVKIRGKEINISSGAQVGGDVSVRAQKQDDVHIDSGATIAGKTDIKISPPRPSQWANPRFYIQKAIGLAIVFLLGLFLYWLVPVLRTARVAGGEELLKSIGVGLVALVVPPVVACVLFILLIGIGVLAKTFLIATLIPMLIAVLWLLTVYMSKVVVGLAIGQALSKSPPGAPSGIALPLLLGLAVVYIVISLPYLGHVLNLGVWLVGLGIGVLHLWRHHRAAAPLPA